MTDHITASPLTWPDGWKRENGFERSRFGTYHNKPSAAAGTDLVLDQLRMMGVPDYQVIVSTNLALRLDGLPRSNQPEPHDAGAAVWWKDEDGNQKVLAVDKYHRVGCNLYAIGKTLEAMRGISRWGGGEILERTFTGFTALPSPDEVNRPHWRKILHYEGGDLAECERAYRKARSRAHPDKGGDDDLMYMVSAAWEQAKQELA